MHDIYLRIESVALYYFTHKRTLLWFLKGLDKRFKSKEESSNYQWLMIFRAQNSFILMWVETCHKMGTLSLKEFPTC